MALRSAALKMAAVVAVLAVLVLPSFGRCPSLGLAPPAAAPVYVHAWGPTLESAPPVAAPGPADDEVTTPEPGQAPLADAPVSVSGPAYGPTAEPVHLLCSECASHCAWTCTASVRAANCIGHCSPGPGPYCDICRSTALQGCRQRCNEKQSCDCDTDVESSCYSPCHVVQSAGCDACHNEGPELCDSYCNSDCAATCIEV